MHNNIFTVLIMTLNSVRVSGEDDMKKMLGVINTLKDMEARANVPDSEVDGDG